MKTICLINLLSLIFVITCNFETSDLPYFNGLFHDAYLDSVSKLKLAMKSYILIAADM